MQKAMKFVYATDLHGDAAKYRALLDVAVAENCEAIVNGGDMLPAYGVDMVGAQREFLHGALREHLLQAAHAGIHWLGLLGNDDLAAFDAPFDTVLRNSALLHNLAQTRVVVGGHEFIGMNWVTDYPFRLKDRCRLDGTGSRIPEQLGTALVSIGGQITAIDDWGRHVSCLPTIEDELQRLPQPAIPETAIYVMHMPPSGAGLDMCCGGRAVGSEAIREFIAAHQPLITLHGHIHESPMVSGRWRNWIGRTVCVQPGQNDDDLVCVLIDTNDMRTERLCVPCR